MTTGQGPTNGESNVAYGFGMLRVTSRNNQSGNPSVPSSIGSGFQVDGDSNECIDCIAHNNGKIVDPDGRTGYGMYISGTNGLVRGGEYYDNSGFGIHQFRSGGGSNSKNIMGQILQRHVAAARLNGFGQRHGWL